MPEYLLYTLIGSTVALLLGIGLLYWAGVADRKNYIIQKATPLPLSLVNVRDDVWLSGMAETDSPLISPHFSINCLYYSYTKSQRVVETRRDSEGKTHREEKWVVRERRSDATNFRLRDSNLTIDIVGKEADFQHCEHERQQIGDWRYSLDYFPYPSPVNAVGCVSEGKTRLEAYENIPLIVTSLDRQAFIEKAESAEVWMRGGSFFLIWAGLAALVYGMFEYQAFEAGMANPQDLTNIYYGLAVATPVMFTVWSAFKYNVLVAYRLRCQNAWRQIDVDLKMRHTLIPQLVDVAKGYMAHETEVLASLTELRNEAMAASTGDRIRREQALDQSISGVMAVIEAYPDLKAQPILEKVFRELRAIEDKIAHARAVYNDAVNEYNDNVMSLPDSLIARLFGFKTMEFYAAG
jgi:LemA protein